MEAAGRPDGQVASLYQNRREPAHRSVANDAGPGRAAADDEHFRFEGGHATSQYRSGPRGERAGGLGQPRARTAVAEPSASSVLVEPVEGPRDGLLPEPVLLFAFIRVHPGLPLLVLAPVGAQVLHLRPEADGEAGGVGS